MATTGLGQRRIWTWKSVMWNRPTPRLAASSSPRYPASPRTLWSPPEQKASGPSPVRMITPTSRSSRALERIRHLDHGLRPEGVAHLRPVDRDLRDALGDFVPDVGVFACRLPVDRHGAPTIM